MPETPDILPGRAAKKSEWPNRIVSALLGIVVSVLGSVILGRLQAREPHLVYWSTEALPFSGQNGNVSIYQVSVSNDGKKEISDVGCVIRVLGAKVDQYKVTANPLLNASTSISNDSVNIQIPNLNPSESVQIALLVTSSMTLPVRPEILARGKGITGTEKNMTKDEGAPTGISTLLVATAAVALSGVFLSLLRQKSMTNARKSLVNAMVPEAAGPPGDDQRQVLAFVCRVYGLRALADQYIAQTHETTYWAEADRLGQMGTDNPGGEQTAAIERVLAGLLDYNPEIAKASIAIVYYNLALISLAKKDKVANQKYIQLAKDISPAEINRRLKVDKRFADH